MKREGDAAEDLRRRRRAFSESSAYSEFPWHLASWLVRFGYFQTYDSNRDQPHAKPMWDGDEGDVKGDIHNVEVADNDAIS